MPTPSGPVGQTHWGDSTAKNLSPTTHSADAQLKQAQLAAIFKKICDEQTCTIGLYGLHRITQIYPQVDLSAHLQNASEAFRTYIRDGLAQMEKNAAAGRTSSSLPMSTPPPVSLSSPEFAPLSPVHTNSLNDAKSQSVKLEYTNSNLTLPHADDNRAYNTLSSRGSSDHFERRQNVGDERNDRYPSGITSGTLDAIRERMKSIQLAAVAGNPEADSRSMNGNMMAHGPPDQVPHGSVRVDPEVPVQTGVLTVDEKALSGLQTRMERLKIGTIE
uniref:Uncharacterized protein n=1 Tax=Nelumbo nucifera TaxID=4432 RepID=A0A822XPM9_NELNU|nr:TPA_asm: hypothetical protein HUJ06_022339 [Nelumbo nucifera]